MSINCFNDVLIFFKKIVSLQESPNKKINEISETCRVGGKATVTLQEMPRRFLPSLLKAPQSQDSDSFPAKLIFGSILALGGKLFSMLYFLKGLSGGGAGPILNLFNGVASTRRLIMKEGKTESEVCLHPSWESDIRRILVLPQKIDWGLSPSHLSKALELGEPGQSRLHVWD